jgi:hypothetical protein
MRLAMGFWVAFARATALAFSSPPPPPPAAEEVVSVGAEVRGRSNATLLCANAVDAARAATTVYRQRCFWGLISIM